MSEGEDSPRPSFTLGLTPEAKAKLYETVFQSIDVDHSGALSLDELGEAAVALGLNGTVEEVFGVGPDDALSLEGFVEAMERYESNNPLLDDNSDFSDSESGGFGISQEDIDENRLRGFGELFAALDENENGVFTSQELGNHMRNLNLREGAISNEGLALFFSLMGAADEAGEAGVGWEEFLEIAKEHPEYFDARMQRRRMVEKEQSFREESESEEESSEGALAPMENHFSEDDKERFRQVFSEFDVERKGVICDADVNAMMNRLGRVPTEQESEFLFELLQLVGQDGFSFEEFLVLMAEESEPMLRLGRSVSTWRGKLNKQERAVSRQRLKQEISRIGIRAALEKEELRLSRNELRSGLQTVGSGLRTKLKGLEKEDLPRPSGPEPRLLPTLHSDPLDSFASESSAKSKASAGVQDNHANRVLASLTPLELMRYRALFSAMDVDGGGTVTKSEMLFTLRGLIGREASEQEIDGFIMDCDPNGNGYVEFHEFVRAMKRVEEQKEGSQTERWSSSVSDRNHSQGSEGPGEGKLDGGNRARFQDVFDRFDVDEDGVISRKDLEKAMRAMGKKLSPAACDKLFAKFNVSGSGYLDMDEFAPFLSSLVAKHVQI